jgi:hypothetical protein
LHIVISDANIHKFIVYQNIFTVFQYLDEIVFFLPLPSSHSLHMKKLQLSLLFVLILSVQAQPQSVESAAATITIPEITEHMKILASEAMEGRKTGEPGIEKAKEYLVNEFRMLGLTNPITSGTPYLQEFDLYQLGWKNYDFIQGTDTIRFQEDFIVMGTVPEIHGEYEFVYAGYGIEHPRYNNYKGLDVKGKIVIYFIGEPKDKNGNFITTGSKLTGYPRYESRKDSIAFAHGAVSTIRIDPAEEIADRMIRSNAVFGRIGLLTISKRNDQSPANRNYVYSTLSATSRIMGMEKDELKKAYQALEKGQQKVPSLSGKVQCRAVRYPETVKVANVAGLLEGTDLKDEVVVITAHYDHLGIKKTGICVGADDNASGTIGILEIAEAFVDAARNGIRPRRSILFLAVTGEEEMLLGSKYYCSNPLFPIEKTFTAINMDMIGRCDEKHTTNEKYVYLYVTGQKGEWLHQAAKRAHSSMTTDLLPEFQFRGTSSTSVGGSDHMSFEDVKVPVAYFFNGTHADYHSPRDTWDKIQYDQMREIVNLVFLTAWEIANSEVPDYKK